VFIRSDDLRFYLCYDYTFAETDLDLSRFFPEFYRELAGVCNFSAIETKVLFEGGKDELFCDVWGFRHLV